MSPNVSPSSPAVPAPLKAERVQLQMQQLPGWCLSRDSRQAWRHFRFPSRRRTIAFLRQAIHAAESAPAVAGSPGPTVAYRGDSVTLSIWTRDGAFAEADVALVRSVVSRLS